VDNRIETRLPKVPDSIVAALCAGLRVRYIGPWHSLITNRTFWASWLFNDIYTHFGASEDCEASVRKLATTVRFCTLRNVKVGSLTGKSLQRNMFNESHVFSSGPVSRCRDNDTASSGTDKHAFIAWNVNGKSFYHTMYDTLGSIAFAAEYLAANKNNTVVVMNQCIDASSPQAWSPGSVHNYTCTSDIDDFVGGMLELFGIDKQQIFQHPVREGIANLSEATFQCNEWSRTFWHARKLREVFFQSLSPHAPPRNAIIVVERTHGTRSVVNHVQMLLALRQAFPSFDVVNYQGHNYTFRQAAELFRRAVVVVGPHGAGEALLMFCSPGTDVVEFTKVGVANSPLYMAYCNVFQLRFWTVVDANPHLHKHVMYNISVQDVVLTVQAALDDGIGLNSHSYHVTNIHSTLMAPLH